MVTHSFYESDHPTVAACPVFGGKLASVGDSKARAIKGVGGLESPRAKEVLELAAERGGWGRSLPPRSGRGISLIHAFGETYIAQVAEVSVSNEGDVRVQIDCGTMVNPDITQCVEAYLPIGSNPNGLSVTQL